jgi:RpiB/LacA/LacB family sugar-phosphate isomerase
MRIAIGSDHAAYEPKQALVEQLRAAGHEIEDCGCDSTASVDYPDFAEKVARLVSGGGCERGVALCGTGIGACMAANKVPGVRAAVVHDRYTARMSREHNDANVLCMGARVLDAALLLELAAYWLELDFEGGRHERRVRKIDALLPRGP